MKAAINNTRPFEQQYEEGAQARRDGKPQDANPYVETSDDSESTNTEEDAKHFWWYCGWQDEDDR